MQADSSEGITVPLPVTPYVEEQIQRTMTSSTHASRHATRRKFRLERMLSIVNSYPMQTR